MYSRAVGKCCKYGDDIVNENIGEKRQAADKTSYYLNFQSNVLQVRNNLLNIIMHPRDRITVILGSKYYKEQLAFKCTHGMCHSILYMHPQTFAQL